jgi:hypothetical protein
MMTTKKHTKESIRELLSRNDRAVERAVVAIFNFQTRDEQATEDTRHHNNVGFTSWAARKGTYYAKWVQKGRRLTGHHLANARKIANHHAGQLAKIANGELELN